MTGKMICLAPFFALAACGTIDQVPLVYVSSMKIGVNVASGTAEAPGAKLNIGYDGTDAAFVPVFGGRKCDYRVADACKDLPLIPIWGSNDISPAEFVAAARVQADALKRYATEVTDAQSAVSQALRRQAEVQRRADAFDSDRSRLGLMGSAPVAGTDGITPPDPFAGPRGVLQDAIKNGPPTAELADTTEAVSRASAALSEKMTGLERGRRDLLHTLDQAPDQLGARHDALSVYGSFDSNTNASAGIDKPVAALNLGKSFSTGIAAQLLTEGIRDSSTSRAQTNCLLAARAVATTASGGTATVDPGLLALGLQACNHKSSSD